MKTATVIRHLFGAALGFGLALAAGGAAAGPAAATPSAPQSTPLPSYEAASCCQLCPRAQNPAAYDTAFLQSFTTLIDGRNGWLFRTDEDLRTDFRADDAGLRSLKQFNAALKRRGITLVMVVQPPRGLMEADKLLPADRKRYDAALAHRNYTQLLAKLRAQGVAVPDLDALVDAERDDDFFFRGDHHWTPEGSRLTAERTAATIRALPQYSAVPKQRFVTTRTGLFPKRGTMQKAALLLCGTGSADQYVSTYASEPQNSDLLGDSAAPAVTLVGTSNSEGPYNFSGFLSEFLETDILNVSIAGGGLDGSMLSYLPSKEFRDSPPRLLIWELEAYHNLSNQDFWRQLLPQLDNGCTAGAPKLKKTSKLRNGRNEVLFNGGGKMQTLASRDHLVEVRFDDPNVKDLTAVVWYANGRKETVTLKQSEHAIDKGVFAFNLRDEPGWAELTFMSLDVMQAQAPAKTTTVEARVCTRKPAGPMQTAGNLP